MGCQTGLSTELRCALNDKRVGVLGLCRGNVRTRLNSSPHRVGTPCACARTLVQTAWWPRTLRPKRLRGRTQENVPHRVRTITEFLESPYYGLYKKSLGVSDASAASAARSADFIREMVYFSVERTRCPTAPDGSRNTKVRITDFGSGTLGVCAGVEKKPGGDAGLHLESARSLSSPAGVLRGSSRRLRERRRRPRCRGGLRRSL